MDMRTTAATLTRTALDLYGAASERGGWHRGAGHGPSALIDAGVVAWLARRGLDVRWRETVRPEGGEDTGPALDAVASLCRRLADRVEDSVLAGRTFGVFGGDHSCAIGTWSGVANAVGRAGPIGLVWFDAHMDAHTPATSPSGRLHGMPIACLMGHGDDALVSISRETPALRPDKICLVGVRSFEDGEHALLERLGVRVIFMHEVRTRGLDNVVEEAFAIARKGTVGFGVSVDLDVLDPSEAPGVGSRAEGGMAGRDLAASLARVRGERNFLGLEIAEYNPIFDENGRTARQVRRLLAAAFLDGDNR
jgi:arginase